MHFTLFKCWNLHMCIREYFTFLSISLSILQIAFYHGQTHSTSQNNFYSLSLALSLKLKGIVTENRINWKNAYTWNEFSIVILYHSVCYFAKSHIGYALTWHLLIFSCIGLNKTSIMWHPIGPFMILYKNRPVTLKIRLLIYYI